MGDENTGWEGPEVPQEAQGVNASGDARGAHRGSERGVNRGRRGSHHRGLERGVQRRLRHDSLSTILPCLSPSTFYLQIFPPQLSLHNPLRIGRVSPADPPLHCTRTEYLPSPRTHRRKYFLTPTHTNASSTTACSTSPTARALRWPIPLRPCQTLPTSHSTTSDPPPGPRPQPVLQSSRRGRFQSALLRARPGLEKAARRFPRPAVRLGLHRTGACGTTRNLHAIVRAHPALVGRVSRDALYLRQPHRARSRSSAPARSAQVHTGTGTPPRERSTSPYCIPSYCTPPIVPLLLYPPNCIPPARRCTLAPTRLARRRSCSRSRCDYITVYNDL